MSSSTFELIYLAPFQGITDAIYRSSLARHFGGIDAAFTPYISGTGIEKVSKNKLTDVMPAANLAVRTIPQILSKDAGEMMLLAKSLADLGYTEINWNMGCPFPRVARKQRGSGLLPYPETVRKILDELFQNALPVKLSVKMRTGYADHAEATAMAAVLNDYPLSEVIVHPRTGKQLYKGEASEDAFAVVYNLICHPLAWNGDIFSVERFRELQSRFPAVKRWMIGRGALQNPALPLAIADIQAYHRLDLPLAFHHFLQDIFTETYNRNEGRTAVVSRMKGIWVYLCHGFTDPLEAFRIVRKTKTPEEYLDASARVLANCKINQID